MRFVHGLQVRQVFLSLFRLSVYTKIQETHNCHRHVKGRDGRAEGDVLIGQYELYVTLRLGHGPATLDDRPQVDPRRPKAERNDPRGR